MEASPIYTRARAFITGKTNHVLLRENRGEEIQWGM